MGAKLMRTAEHPCSTRERRAQSHLKRSRKIILEVGFFGLSSCRCAWIESSASAHSWQRWWAGGCERPTIILFPQHLHTLSFMLGDQWSPARKNTQLEVCKISQGYEARESPESIAVPAAQEDRPADCKAILEKLDLGVGVAPRAVPLGTAALKTLAEPAVHRASD
jgi:hypothetical protein